MIIKSLFFNCKLKHFTNRKLWLKPGLPKWLSGKESTCQAGDSGLTLGSGRSPGEGNGNSLQDSCLENPMGRGAWQAMVPGVAVSKARLRGKFMAPNAQEEISQINDTSFDIKKLENKKRVNET